MKINIVFLYFGENKEFFYIREYIFFIVCIGLYERLMLENYEIV